LPIQEENREAGARSPSNSAKSRRPLLAAPLDFAWNARYLHLGQKEGHIRARVLLAPTCQLSTKHDTEDQTIVLAPQVSAKRGSRSAQSDCPQASRMEGACGMGMPMRPCGEIAATDRVVRGGRLIGSMMITIEYV
jgi:hypothetical protein